MGAQNATSLAIAALALLWVGLAATIAILAARRFNLAQQVLDAARVSARLLDVTPARPLVVGPDGSIEVDDQLVRGRADYSSISLGQLVVQVVGFRLPVDVERILVPNMRDWSGHAVRVWPPRHPSASWPPTNSFDNETLQQFVRPFP